MTRISAIVCVAACLFISAGTIGGQSPPSAGDCPATASVNAPPRSVVEALPQSVARLKAGMSQSQVLAELGLAPYEEYLRARNNLSWSGWIFTVIYDFDDAAVPPTESIAKLVLSTNAASTVIRVELTMAPKTPKEYRVIRDLK